VILWLLLGAGDSAASPVEFYGFGARRMGRAGGGIALSDGPESILSNPASLPGLPFPELSIGAIYGESSFQQFPELWWDTNQDGLINDQDPGLAAGPQYDPTFGIMIGAALPFGERVALGIGLYVPPKRLLRLATFDPQIPTYFLYSNRNQRYELGLALGVRPVAGLSFGGGVLMIPKARYHLGATLDVALSGAEEGEALGDVVGMSLDVHSMELDLSPGFAPIASMHWRLGDLHPALTGLEVGAAWRGTAGLPVDVGIDLQINARTQDIGELEDIVVPLVGRLELGVYDHYVPPRWEAGIAYTCTLKGREAFTLSADIRHTSWDKLKINVAQVTHSELNGAVVDFGDDPIADKNPYEPTLRATWAPRLGLDIAMPAIRTQTLMGEIGIRLRGGIGFEPTPLVSQGPESALIDAGRMIFAGGLGVTHRNPFWTPEGKGGPDRMVSWDGFLQYHRLGQGELDRGAPEVPTAGYAIDGSAIPIGGYLLAAGAQWSFQY